MYGDANTKEYRDYCRNHWLELIERYKPMCCGAILAIPMTGWRISSGTITTWPEDGHDRWAQSPVLMRNPLAVDHQPRSQKALESAPATRCRPNTTTIALNTTDWQETDIWFEVCRGMDKSFGYNQNSRKEDFITPEEVLRMIAEVYPKKGRLLLNVGPDSYGRIPEYQEEVLEALGTARRA